MEQEIEMCLIEKLPPNSGQPEAIVRHSRNTKNFHRNKSNYSKAFLSTFIIFTHCIVYNVTCTTTEPFLNRGPNSASTTTTINPQSQYKLLLARMKAYWYCTLKGRSKEEGSGPDETEPLLCPASFDGWLCWEPTDTGDILNSSCEYYQDFYSQENGVRSASRRCSANATWEDVKDGNSYSSQSDLPYHPCSPFIDQETMIREQDIYLQVVEATRENEGNLNPYMADRTGKDYEKCILTTLSKPPHNFGKGALFCPRTFDGWSCWTDTLAGHVAQAPCPRHVLGFDHKRFAHKECTVTGFWYRHPDNQRVWSNYTTCVDHDDFEFRNKINSLYVTGYSISVTALIISLVVFFIFQSLKCGRVTIHKNLFISFIVNNVMWIVWYTTVIPYPQVPLDNHISCQILHVILQYFMVSNYFWMFCEGFYLHTLLVLAFVAEIKIMRWLYVIGWGVPLLLTIIYTCVRMNSQDAIEYCWLEDHTSIWIISGPVCFSMFLNLAFLINIVRVLVTKLRAVNSPDSNHTRKAVRATLILIPLLGLHYVIVPFRPETGSSGERVYETTAAIVTSFQGFCVALLFCFFNGEVIALVRKRWKQEIMMRQKDRRTSYAATTISFAAKRSPSEDARHLTSSPAHQKLMSEL